MPPAAAGAAPHDGPAPHPACEYLEAGAAPPEALPTGPAAGERSAGSTGLLPWLAILGLLGFGSLILGQGEAAFFIGVAGLFVAAQGADARPGWRRIDAVLTWVVPVAGAVFLVALARMFQRGEFPPGVRLVLTLLSAASALLCLASLARPVGDATARLLFRERSPGHTLRLAARLVLVALLLALPSWAAVRGELSSLLEDPRALVSGRSLSGSLVGYVVLALASVGWLVRRTWREALARLGLAAVGPRDIALIAAGVVVLGLFNSGSEWVQKIAFPALWRSDQRFTEALAGIMGPGRMVLLGVSAGVGEEITLRGALQPRLGVVRTSLVFAVLHVQYSWYGIASIFVFGLILGLIRRRSSTTAAIAVHALYDVLALVSARP
jgi:hypothetical protein